MLETIMYTTLVLDMIFKFLIMGSLTIAILWAVKGMMNESEKKKEIERLKRLNDAYEIKMKKMDA